MAIASVAWQSVGKVGAKPGKYDKPSRAVTHSLSGLACLAGKADTPYIEEF